MTRLDNTNAILSAIADNPNASDQEIADALGLTRQWVAKVRKEAHGPRPAGKRRIAGEPLELYSLRLQPNLEELAASFGEDVPTFVRRAIALRTGGTL